MVWQVDSDRNCTFFLLCLTAKMTVTWWIDSLTVLKKNQQKWITEISSFVYTDFPKHDTYYTWQGLSGRLRGLKSLYHLLFLIIGWWLISWPSKFWWSLVIVVGHVFKNVLDILGSHLIPVPNHSQVILVEESRSYTFTIIIDYHVIHW